MSEAYPRKRKNDEYYEPFVQTLLRWLGRVLVFCFHYLIQVPVGWLWQATHWTLRLGGRGLAWAWRASLWTLKQPLRTLAWLWGLGVLLLVGRIPEFDTAREREIYLRIRRHFRRRNRFITHLFVFIMGLGLIWIEWFSREALYRNTSAFFISLVWAVVLLLHYIRLRMGEAEDAALEAALEREYARQQPVYYEETEAYYGD